METGRGRWFLAEYTRRNRGADTLMLLDAIRKLERGMVESATGVASQPLSDELAEGLHRLSDTIGATLSRIMHTQDVWGAVTEVPIDAPDDVLVGQMRSAIEELCQVRRQIDALLADQIDAMEPRVRGELTAENMSYFKGDEDLFEVSDESVSAPSLVVVGGEEPGGDSAAAAPSDADPKAKAEPKMKPDPKADPRDRIVFIRRATSDDMAIPLAEETDEDSGDAASTGRSQPGS